MDKVAGTTSKLVIILAFTALISVIYFSEANFEQNEISLLVYSNTARTQQTNSNYELIILVFSKRDNFKRRETIRQTWAKNKTHVYFMVGKDYCPYPKQLLISNYACTLKPTYKFKSDNFTTSQKKLAKALKIYEESITNKLIKEDNIVLLDIMDYYQSLTKKLKFSLKWVRDTIIDDQGLSITPRWIMKIDDDCLLDIEKYQEKLIKNYKNDQFLYFGRFSNKNKKILKTGKWAEMLYPKKRYPIYAEGNSGYSISVGILKFLTEKNTFQNLIEYQNEDTSMGIWLDESPFIGNITFGRSNSIAAINLDNKKSYLCEENSVLGDKQRNNFKNKHKNNRIISLGHNLTPNEMKFCWKELFLK